MWGLTIELSGSTPRQHQFTQIPGWLCWNELSGDAAR